MSATQTANPLAQERIIIIGIVAEISASNTARNRHIDAFLATPEESPDPHDHALQRFREGIGNGQSWFDDREETMAH